MRSQRQKLDSVKFSCEIVKFRPGNSYWVNKYSCTRSGRPKTVIELIKWVLYQSLRTVTDGVGNKSPSIFPTECSFHFLHRINSCISAWRLLGTSRYESCFQQFSRESGSPHCFDVSARSGLSLQSWDWNRMEWNGVKHSYHGWKIWKLLDIWSHRSIMRKTKQQFSFVSICLLALTIKTTWTRIGSQLYIGFACFFLFQAKINKEHALIKSNQIKFPWTITVKSRNFAYFLVNGLKIILIFWFFFGFPAFRPKKT